MAKKSFQDLQKSMVAFNRGSSPRVAEMTRDAFFDGRQDVSADRLARRAFQEQRTTDFKNKFTKQVPNTGGSLLQMTPGAPRSLAAERERLANLYGPTPREVMGDIGRGIGNIFSGIAERGTPVMQLIKTAGSGIMDFLNRPNTQNQNQMIGVPRQVGFGSQELNDFNSLNISQQNTYNMLRKSGLAHMQAFDQAKNQGRELGMAMGGIATLQ